MKALSNGFVFDTELATLVAKQEMTENGTTNIYVTEAGRFFQHYVPGTNENCEPEFIEHIKDATLIDKMIRHEELDKDGEKFEVYLENFPIG